MFYASQSYDCKDKKIKSKKQVLRFKIWQGELIHRFKVNNFGLAAASFFYALNLAKWMMIQKKVRRCEPNLY